MTETLTIECPLCGGRYGALVLWGEELLFHLPGRFAVVSCQQCGLYQSWPILAFEALRQYYPAQYYGGTPQARAIKRRPHLLSLGRRLYHQLRRGGGISYSACFLPPSWIDLALPMHQTPGRLLDVGAGGGRFVAGAIGMGWQAEALDVGPWIRCIGKKLKIPVYMGTLEETLDHIQGGYDLISFNHVLEHVPAPVETLQAARRLLRDGGVVRIQVPLWHAGGVRIFGRYWLSLDLPRHRWHFRPSDIRRLAWLAGLDRILYVPESGTHPLSTSLRLWMRDHPPLDRWQHVASVDNRGMRAIFYPLGWGMAVIGMPLEATFYLMKI